MSNLSRDGAFSIGGPAVYLTDEPAQAEALLTDMAPPAARWYHATSEEGAAGAVQWGLIPGCWRGDGGLCAVFGVDRPEDVHAHQGGWVLEVCSCALPGQLKAWWVPARCVVSVLHDGRRHSVNDLRTRPLPPPRINRCGCGLAALVEREQARWRTTGHAEGGSPDD